MYFLTQAQALDVIVEAAHERIPAIAMFKNQVGLFVTMAYLNGLRLAKSPPYPAGAERVPTDGRWWCYNDKDAYTVLRQKALEAKLPMMYVDMVLEAAVPQFYAAGFRLMAPNPLWSQKQT